MDKERLMAAVLNATPEQLAAMAQALTGNGNGRSDADLRLLTKTEAAKILGVSRFTLYGWLSRGKLPTVAMPDGGSRIPRWAVAELVGASHKADAKEAGQPEAV